MPKKTIFFAIFLAVITAGLFLPFDIASAALEESTVGTVGGAEANQSENAKGGGWGGGLLNCITEPGACATRAAVTMLTAVFFAAMSVLASLFELAGFLVNYAVNLNSVVLVHPIVKIGWIVTRDLANLGFVLAIIIIAFTTIVRAEGFDTKKMLVKLISAAILINFSFVIAGVFLDFAGMLGSYFLDQANIGKKSGADLGSALSNSFNIGVWSSVEDTKPTTRKVKNCPDPGFNNISADFIQNCPEITKTIPPSKASEFKGIEDDLGKMLKLLASIVFAVLFTILGTISFLAVAIMLLVRYIALGMLMILMPIAWLMWILPQTEGMWKQWWGKFMQYTFFFPAVSFFLYLAVAITFFQGTINDVVPASKQGPSTDPIIMQMKTDDVIAQMILVLGFLIGGLMVSQKLGVAGAGAGMAMANRVKSGAQNYMKNRATGARDRALSRYGTGTASALAGMPGLRGLATRIAAATKGLDKGVKDQMKDMMALGPAVGKLKYSRNSRYNAALAAAQAQRGQLSGDNAAKYMSQARQYGLGEHVEAAHPNLATNPDAAWDEADYTKVHADAITTLHNTPSVLARLRIDKIQDVINAGDREKFQAISEEMGKYLEMNFRTAVDPGASPASKRTYQDIKSVANRVAQMPFAYSRTEKEKGGSKEMAALKKQMSEMKEKMEEAKK